MRKYKMDEKRIIMELLFELGVGRNYVGYEYVCYGIQVLLKDEKLLVYITKGLYAKIALKYKVEINVVERDIRTIKKIVWRYHKDSPLFKGHVKAPSNGVFMDILTYEVQKRIWELEQEEGERKKEA